MGLSALTNTEIFLLFPLVEAQTFLVLGVQNIGPSQFWIMGSAWFRNVYTIFDATDVCC
jgi:hypothetical protein